MRLIVFNEDGLGFRIEAGSIIDLNPAYASSPNYRGVLGNLVITRD